MSVVKRREFRLEVARLKVELLAKGMRVEDDQATLGNVRPALRVRSGSCGGLDILLPGDVYVNCPILEGFAARSPFLLTSTQKGFVLRATGRGDIPVQLARRPEYYSASSTIGSPLNKIGQVCADRLGVGLTNDCFYWRSPERRCKFCSIGLNLRNEKRHRTLSQILEVVDAAFSDPIYPARHLLLGGGTPDGPDAGASRIAEAALAIKSRWDRSIYAMIAPPKDNKSIDLLKESGVDELGMNVELIDQDIAEEIIPGKKHLVGLNRYINALEHAVKVFGPINTRSILVVGLEPPESTLKGVELLASMGVMPILSPFRPMTGTELEGHPPPDPDMLWELCCEATKIAGRYGIPLGPTCIPCQENTLTLPGHPAYRYY